MFCPAGGNFIISAYAFQEQEVSLSATCLAMCYVLDPVAAADHTPYATGPPFTPTHAHHPCTPIHLCQPAQLVYVAFDILYDGTESLINLPLRVRHQRLAQAIKCIPADAEGVALGPPGGAIRGRIAALLPDVPIALPLAGEEKQA